MGQFVSTLGNPWLLTEWNVTRQGEFYIKYGAPRAAQFQREAEKVNAAAIAARPAARTYILTRKIGGGGGGTGSSGDGPPA